MNQLISLTNDANQTMNITLDDGSLVNFSINYYENQQGWFFNLNYQGFKLNGVRLVVSPNILRAWRNVIPFGIACTSQDGYEPLYVTDFTSGRIAVFTLNQSDVAGAETYIQNTYPANAGIFRN